MENLNIISEIKSYKTEYEDGLESITDTRYDKVQKYNIREIGFLYKGEENVIGCKIAKEGVLEIAGSPDEVDMVIGMEIKNTIEENGNILLETTEGHIVKVNLLKANKELIIKLNELIKINGDNMDIQYRYRKIDEIDYVYIEQGKKGKVAGIEGDKYDYNGINKKIKEVYELGVKYKELSDKLKSEVYIGRMFSKVKILKDKISGEYYYIISLIVSNGTESGVCTLNISKVYHESYGFIFKEGTGLYSRKDIKKEDYNKYSIINSEITEKERGILKGYIIETLKDDIKNNVVVTKELIKKVRLILKEENKIKYYGLRIKGLVGVLGEKDREVLREVVDKEIERCKGLGEINYLAVNILTNHYGYSLEELLKETGINGLHLITRINDSDIYIYNKLKEYKVVI